MHHNKLWSNLKIQQSDIMPDPEPKKLLALEINFSDGVAKVLQSICSHYY